MATIDAKLIKLRNGAATIRAATPEDAEQLEVLNQAIDRETEFLMRSPGEFMLTLDEHRQFIVKTRDSKRNLLLVAEQLLRVGLRVAASNSRAIDLYKSMGFDTEGVLRAERMHLDGPQDAMVMARVRTRSS